MIAFNQFLRFQFGSLSQFRQQNERACRNQSNHFVCIQINRFNFWFFFLIISWITIDCRSLWSSQSNRTVFFFLFINFDFHLNQNNNSSSFLCFRFCLHHSSFCSHSTSSISASFFRFCFTIQFDHLLFRMLSINPSQSSSKFSFSSFSSFLVQTLPQVIFLCNFDSPLTSSCSSDSFCLQTLNCFRSSLSHLLITLVFTVQCDFNVFELSINFCKPPVLLTPPTTSASISFLLTSLHLLFCYQSTLRLFITLVSPSYLKFFHFFLTKTGNPQKV